MPTSTIAETAVILAAGVGSRLAPLTDDRPKALVSLGRETILGRMLCLLREHGVKHVIVATGYREGPLREAAAGCGLELSFAHNPHYATTQNVASLACCREHWRGGSFYKLDGDVVFQGAVLERLDSESADLSIAVDGVRALDAEAMKVRVEDGAVRGFGKSLPVEQAAGESIGIERVDADAAAGMFSAMQGAVAAGRTDLYYEDVYSELIETGRLGARAVEVGDLPWTEVDDHEDLARARALIEQGVAAGLRVR